MKSYTEHYLVKNNESLKHYFLGKIKNSEEALSLALKLGSLYLNKRRIFTADLDLKAGDYLRYHSQPKRYATDFCITKRIVFENEDFIVFDKPANIPVVASLDNAYENLIHHLQTNYKPNILVTHRLDIPTSGLIIFAKNSVFQKSFNQLLSQRKVQKLYIAHTRGPINLGLQIHHMEKSKRSPKILHASPQKNTTICKLEVLESLQVNNYYQNLIRLITGKSHQIRAQLAFLSQAIIGDPIYGKNTDTQQNLELVSQAISFTYKDNTWKFFRNNDCQEIKKYL